MSSTRTTNLYSTSFIQLSSYRFSTLTRYYFYSVLFNNHALVCRQQQNRLPWLPTTKRIHTSYPKLQTFLRSLFKISPGHVTERQTKYTIQMATWQFKRNKGWKKAVLITEGWCPNSYVNKNFHCSFHTLYLFFKEPFKQYHLWRRTVVLNIIDIPAMLILSTTTQLVWCCFYTFLNTVFTR